MPGFGSNGGFGPPQGMPNTAAAGVSPSSGQSPAPGQAPPMKTVSKRPATKVKTQALTTTGEVTGQQNRFAYGMPFLFNPVAASYDTYRLMRKHPTIAMIRMLSVAPVIAANWSIESSDDAPEGAVDMIREQLLPLRPLILQEAMLHGLVDFGWCIFEKVFALDEPSKGGKPAKPKPMTAGKPGNRVDDPNNPTFNYGGITPAGTVEQEEAEQVPAGAKIKLTKLKPLLVDISTIMIGMKGEFAGVRQTGPLAHVIDLDVEKCLLVSFAVEGNNWYGNPRMENCRLTYNKWMECDLGAARYDKKIAGSHWVIYYPPGFTGEGDAKKDNFDIAMGILASMEASGSVVVPSTTAAFLDELNQSTDTKRAWEISFIEDKGGKQANFINRLRYLDSLLARALITPERAVTEGQMGTKAEAGIHADAASTAMDLEHQHVCRTVNWHLVNQLLRINYGPDAENSVWIVPAPMDDMSIAFLREVYQSFLTNPTLAPEEFPNINREALRERIGVPALSEEKREELDVEPAEGLLPAMLRGIIASHPDVELHPEPTEAQAKAGNYKKSKLKLYGCNISIENPKLSTRRGMNANGDKWANVMPHHYGYFRSTVGRDGDQIDCVIGPDEHATHAYVITIPDEDKVLLQFNDSVAARHAFNDMYAPSLGEKLFKKIQVVPVAELKSWLKQQSAGFSLKLSNPEGINQYTTIGKGALDKVDMTNLVGSEEDMLPFRTEKQLNQLADKMSRHMTIQEVDPSTLKPSDWTGDVPIASKVASMSSKDMSKVPPIVVVNGEIIDGLHRWSTAKAQGVKIRVIALDKTAGNAVDGMNDIQQSQFAHYAMARRVVKQGLKLSNPEGINQYTKRGLTPLPPFMMTPHPDLIEGDSRYWMTPDGDVIGSGASHEEVGKKFLSKTQIREAKAEDRLNEVAEDAMKASGHARCGTTLDEDTNKVKLWIEKGSALQKHSLKQGAYLSNREMLELADDPASNDFKPQVAELNDNPLAGEHIVYGTVGDIHRLVAHRGTGNKSVVPASNLKILRTATPADFNELGIGT